jgi:hypothetical protein
VQRQELAAARLRRASHRRIAVNEGGFSGNGAGTPDGSARRRSIDVLMVTGKRPAFARRALERLCETSDDSMRLWIWHNGTDEETLAVVHEFLDRPEIHRFHHELEDTGNKRPAEPLDWVLSEGDAAYFSRVGDDCLVPEGWADVLRSAHEEVPELGVVGCWHFRPEDFRPALSVPKIAMFSGGHRILRSCWIEGSGFLMKRACIEDVGLLARRKTFSGYCAALAERGWVNGWYFPFLYQEHMGDPRSPLWVPHPGATQNGAQLEQVRAIQARAFSVQLADPDGRGRAAWHARLRRQRVTTTTRLRRRALPS